MSCTSKLPHFGKFLGTLVLASICCLVPTWNIVAIPASQKWIKKLLISQNWSNVRTNVHDLPIDKCQSKWQCISQYPGLSALNLSRVYPGNGKVTVSLYGGSLTELLLGIKPFRSLPGSDFLSNIPMSSTWNLWPWRWIGYAIISSTITSASSTIEF